MKVTSPDTDNWESLVSMLEAAERNALLPVSVLQFARAALNASQATKLLVGIAGDRHRGASDLVQSLKSTAEHVHVRLLEFTGHEVTGSGQDLWILITAADQLGSLAEKSFVSGLPRQVAQGVLVVVGRVERVEPAEHAEILNYAKSLFEDLGVPSSQIVLGKPSPEECAHEHIRVNSERRTTLRAANLEGLLLQIERPVVAARERLTSELSSVMRTEDDTHARSLQSAIEAVDTLADSWRTSLAEELLAAFDAWWQPETEEVLRFGEPAVENLRRRLDAWFVNRAPLVALKTVDRLVREDSRLAPVWHEVSFDDGSVAVVTGHRPELPKQFPIMDGGRSVPMTIGAPVGGFALVMLFSRSWRWAVVGASVASAVAEVLQRLRTRDRGKAELHDLFKRISEATSQQLRVYARAASDVALADIRRQLESKLEVSRKETAQSLDEVKRPLLTQLEQLETILHEIRASWHNLIGGQDVD